LGVRDRGVAGFGVVTGRQLPRPASTLTGAAGMRVGSTPRAWYFAVGLAVVGCIAIGSVVVRLVDLGGAGRQVPHDAGVTDTFRQETEVMVPPTP
jgi:hypothetical protein